MSDGTNFDIAIAATAKADAIKTVRADVDALKNSTLALAPPQEKAAAAGERQSGSAQGVALASRAGREAANAYALLLSGNYVMAAEKARFVTVGLGTAMRATPWGAAVFGATIALGALDGLIGKLRETEPEVKKTSEEITTLGKESEKSADLAGELTKQIADQTAAAEKAHTAISDLADAELKLAMAQNRVTELEELQKAGGDPVKMAEARAAAAKNAADLKYQGTTGAAIAAEDRAKLALADQLRGAGVAADRAGRYGREGSAARQDQAQAQRQLDEVQRTQAELAAARDAVRQAEAEMDALRKTKGAFDPETTAAETRYGNAATRKWMLEDRAAGRNLPQEAERFAADEAQARKRAEEAEKQRAAFAAEEATFRAAATAAQQALQTARVRKDEAMKGAAVDMVAEKAAADRQVSEARSAAAAKELAKKIRDNDEQAKRDEAAAQARAALPPEPTEQRTKKQIADDKFRDQFRPKGILPSGRGQPAGDQAVRDELMSRARETLGGEGADAVLLEMFRKLLDRTQAADRAAAKMRAEVDQQTAQSRIKS
jgi:hypothetical protein